MDPKKLPPRKYFTHSVDLQLRFNDVDVLGHLNNTIYFSFYDTGKAYFFEHIMNSPMQWKHVDCVIANVDCAYISPIYFGEQIQVWTRVSEIHDKSFRLQQMLVEKNTGELKSACESVMVSFDPDTKQAVPMKEEWRRALTATLIEENDREGIGNW